MREEVTRRGLTVNHSRIQVAKQYALLEQRIPEAANSSSSLPPYLAVFSSTVLKRELRRRSPHLSFSGSQSPADLLTLLRSTQPGQVSGLPALLKQLSTAKTQPTTEALLQVLPQLTDLTWLPQNDWNVLRESNPDSLVPLWQGLFQALPTLDKDQFITLIRAACINVTSIGMHFTPESHLQLAPDLVNKVLDRAVALKKDIRYQEMGHVVQFSELFSGNHAQIKLLKQEILERLHKEEMDTLAYSTMSEIYFLLPDEAYSTHSALISALQQRLFPLRKSFPSDFAWKSIHHSLRLLSPIPRALLREHTVLSTAHLRLLPPSDMLKLLESLADSELLTEQIVRHVCDLCNQALHNPASASLLVNVHYLLHKKGVQGLSLKRLAAAQALATRSEYKLTIGELLKLGVAIYPHFSGTAMARRILEEFSSVSATSPDLLLHKELLPELLTLVAAGCIEQPIYNYQYFSYSSVANELRHRLAERLATLVLQLQLDRRPVWKYHAHALMADCLPTDLLNALESSKDWNVEDVAYCLWRYQAQIPTFDVYTSHLLSHPALSLQSLFYLSQIAPSESILPIFQRLIGDIKGCEEYFLPLVDALKLDIAKDQQLLKIYKENVRENIHPGAVYGQALYRTIIQLGNIREYELIARLTQGLGFVPRSEPLPVPQLLETLADTLVSAHFSVPLSVKSVAKLYGEDSGLQVTQRARAKVKALVQGEDTTAKSSLEEEDLARLKTANATEMVQLLCRLPLSSTTPIYSQALSFISPSSFSAAIFPTLESARVLHSAFLQRFIQHLTTEKDVKETLEIGRRVMNYLAVVGEETLWPKVKKALGRAEIVQKMDWKMAANYAFLCLGEQGGLKQMPEALFSKIYSVVPHGNEEALNSSSIPNLQRFLPFDLQYELEERTLETNNYVGKNTKLVFHKRALLSKEDAEAIVRIRAVKNYLKMQISSIEDSALDTLRSLRVNTPEFQEFRNDIEAMTTDTSIFTRELQTLQLSHRDVHLGWDLDAAFPKQKIGIILYLDQDVIKSATGSELLPCFLTKQQKYQLQKFTKWNLFAIRFRVWRQLSRQKRQDLLSHILQKHSN